MEIKAKAKFVKGSPRRARLLADLVRGKNLPQALILLSFAKQKAALDIHKVLASAAANAEHNFNLVRDKLLVKEIRVDVGPVLKRSRPRAFGRSAPIRKRSCHISVILEELNAKG